MSTQLESAPRDPSHPERFDDRVASRGDGPAGVDHAAATDALSLPRIPLGTGHTAANPSHEEIPR